jgi:subtilisin family serine protease
MKNARTAIFIVWILGGLCVLNACQQGRILMEYPILDLDPLPKTRIEPNHGLPQAPNFQNQQWNLQAVQAEAVWAEHPGSINTRIMIVGTGVNYNHPDLIGRVYINQREYSVVDPESGLPTNGKDDDGNGWVDDFVGWDYVDEDGLAFDHYGFDTAAAGIIGALHDNNVGIHGIMKFVSLYPVRYIDSDGMAKLPNLILALKHSFLIGELPDVILLNLLNLKISDDTLAGQAEISLLKGALAALQARGIPVVIGSGNNPTSMEHVGEGNLLRLFDAYDNVIVVSSTNNRRELAPLAYFNHFLVDILSPGQDIVTTDANGHWTQTSGTYLGAAHVAGALGLVKSKFNVTLPEILQVLYSEEGSDAFPTEDLRSRYSNKKQLNIHKLLTTLAR